MECHWPAGPSPELAERWRVSGDWRDLTLAQSLAKRLDEDPGGLAVVDDLRRVSFAELDAMARALAGWFEAQGLRPGDVVAFQLPNWHETAAVAVATSLLGLVCLPVIPIYREAEVRFILEASRARVFLTPETFRGYDHAALAARMAEALPGLVTLALRSPASEQTWKHPPHEGAGRGRADLPWMLMYTSGTTGRPKGVVHSVQSLDSECGHVAAWWDLRPGRDVTLMPSPVTHVTGFLYGLMMPMTHGIPAVLMDRWDAARALELIAREKVTFTCSATPFLRELLDAAEATGQELATLRVFACGGAPVPPDLIRMARARHPGLNACRVYGSTEAPTVSLGVAGLDDSETAATTEGHVVGHELRLLAEDGTPLPPGSEGEIAVRGPEMCRGYLDPTDHAAAFDAEGFFRTGDMGVLDAAGRLTITGRRKDLIIRGGENLSPKEIEDALHRHPRIREAAVVAMPHPRLGETCCAVIVADSPAPDVAALSAFLKEQGLAMQKHPERVEVVAELPRTASGKVQKFLLRERLFADRSPLL